MNWKAEEILSVWTIYLCGRDIEGKEEADWRARFKQELGSKYSILEPDAPPKTNEGQPTNTASLDQFTSKLHEQMVTSGLTKIEKADLVVANTTTPSFEVAIQLFYGHLLRKSVLLFAGIERTSEREMSYVIPVADMFFNSYDKLVKFLKEMTILPQPRKAFLQRVFLDALQKEMVDIYAREDIKTPLFRSAILATQLGQLFHYLTHDRAINPGARSVGSRADEEAQLGDCLVQLIIYSLSRGFDIADIYSIGLKRMQEAVWRGKQPIIQARELRPNEIGYAISASQGEVSGRVVVVRTIEDANKISEGPCIVAIFEYQKPVWDEIIARIENVVGVISGTGSPNSHPAIVCRELKKPCIVGAKETVDKLKDNMTIKMIVGDQIDKNTVLKVTSQ